MGPIWMTLLLVSMLGLFSWSAFRRLRQVTIGVPDPRFAWTVEQIVDRAKTVLVYAFGQRRMPTYRLAGLAHIGIFVAFLVLLLNSVMLWVRGFDAGFDFWGVLSVDRPVGQLYAFLREVAALLAILGSVVFLYFRWVKRGHDSGDPAAVKNLPRMTLGHQPNRYVFTEGILILFIIITMMGADYLYVGATLVIDARAIAQPLEAGWWEPVSGGVVAQLVSGLESEQLVSATQHVGFWWHASFVLIFLNILPYTKHFHVLTVMPNVFAYDRRPNALPKVDDLEGRVEREESLGIARLSDLTYKHLLDLYTCTECGRCSDNCPAYITGKVLSPKHLTLAMRDHLYAAEKKLFSEAAAAAPASTGTAVQVSGTGAVPIHTFPPAPSGAYFVSNTVVDLVPNVIHPDVIWGCTSCRACEEQCPVMISYVDKIIALRREEVMMKSAFPSELQGAFQGIETNGNPWNLAAGDRGSWADGLDVPLLSDNPSAEVLYWVGCAASYDDRAKRVARALVKLLKKAGVDFAILGPEETCTGDPARRAGNEYLFQILAEQNIETFTRYEVAKKTVLTACPHCFNTLGNEYRDFGGEYNVVHHSAFLAGLLKERRLTPTKPVNGKVVYHDSCYLGRYNQVYDAPRTVLESIDGVELAEVPYWNRQRGLCCGAGGAQMFMEEQGEERVNNKRTLQLLDTGATTIASSCPFCMTMLTDGVKNQERQDTIGQRDIAEILADAVGVDVMG